ncbi:MAG: hypothetical protein ACLTDX_00180 [[Clostridium] innocuum]
MKALYASYEGDEEMLKKLSIYSAFELYLDFYQYLPVHSAFCWKQRLALI